MFNLPIIFNTDSYKFSHYLGYPPGTTEIYSYAESRGGVYRDVVVMGMTAVTRLLLEFELFERNIDDAFVFSKDHNVPFNYIGWKRLFEKYATVRYLNSDNGDAVRVLTKLPVRIEGLPDGTVTRTREPLFAVYNTDPEFPWLTSYLETALLRVWYSITVASRVFKMKQAIQPYFRETSESENDGFGVLDFGSRGTSSTESSALGGLGHLASFVGSDNLPAIYLANRVYKSNMAAFSVAATEHSIMTAWEPQNELQSFEYLIENMAPEGGILSVVSDSWDIFAATDKWISLREKIRNKRVKLVVRPDSGEMKEVLPILFDKLEKGFGFTINSKGYKVLNDVGLLWGDGINENTVVDPFIAAKWAGISADSIITGSGGGILQVGLDRDTMKFAFKASNAIVDGRSIPIAKQPITDPGKVSKKGKFTFPYIYYDNGVFGEPIKLDDIRASIAAALTR